MSQSTLFTAAPEAWIQATGYLVNGEQRKALTVCDTAFGDGCRFLALWSFWRQHRMQGAKLQVIAFSAAQSWGVIRDQRTQPIPVALQMLDAVLEAQWPDALPGVHRLSFENGAVTLTLIFHPLSIALRQTEAIVDVFWVSDGEAFLSEAGGASPAGQLVRLAGARAQVVTPAGGNAPGVRSALVRAGFQIDHGVSESGGLVRGWLRPGLCHTRRSSYVGADVLVVGAGVAGAAIAYGLAQRGHRARVFDPTLKLDAAGVHAGHFAAAISPYLSKDDDYRARLTRAGVARAWANWSGLAASARPIRCGALSVPADERGVALWQEILRALGFPEDWVCWLGADAASKKVNERVDNGGCYRASGLLIRPNRLLPALLAEPGVSCVGEAVAEIRRLAGGGGWVRTESGAVYEAPVVVLANARNIGPLLGQLTQPGDLPKLERMQAVPGQVSYFDARVFGGGPKCVLDGAAYWLPEVEGVLTAGGTYNLDQEIAAVTAQGHREIIEQLNQFLPARQIERLGSRAILGGWAGWRAVVTGRLPVVGPLGGLDDIWLATAYGSRGLTWAALAADLIGGKLNDEPAIIERDLLAALLPR